MYRWCTTRYLRYLQSHDIDEDDFIENVKWIAQDSLVDKNRMHIFRGDINIDLLDLNSASINIAIPHSYEFTSMINKVTCIEV